MKTDAELEALVRKMYREMRVGIIVDPIQRLRQLEHDAVLDFIELTGNVNGFLRDLAAQHKIRRATSIGFASGKCKT